MERARAELIESWFQENGWIGPKPFRTLDVWQRETSFKVRSKWNNYEIFGFGMIVLKEKLKRLKAYIKIWNKEVFGNVNQEVEKLSKRVQELDDKDDESGLSEGGRLERKILLANLSKSRLKQEVIAFQKEKCKWVKQGDLNTKYFHAVTRWRRIKNGMNGLADFVRAIQSFKNSEVWPKGLNASFIVLVPKRRGLLDSVLIANETLEEVKMNKSSCLFLKADYEKTYDSVRWDFLYYMLGRLGFGGKWIRWIKACLESASVSILVKKSLFNKGIQTWEGS
ncbi:uncharacterized protein [Phaseolus vulgaris]|uniref:uncharacterized protein n=1 Tax=Phaseolus vulgaris TaxID=3885 RepID=UPI0035CC82FD